MSDIGQAYVQVIPTTKGIKGELSKALGDEAASAGTSSGESLAKNMISSIKGAIAAAGIGKLISDTIAQGADYEQNVGGMETLYKDASDKMVQYANDAFKTAQMSANDYMSTATSFSASLLSSMGGDTQKAADAANQAIIDMSDNANKMGTDMSSIQDAYRGFAKQNYTMLDNLSLGYGGTKTEMERLLADAEKLTGVHYDISNLNDVYSAIHVIQQEMGITGTSAKEGAATISGSIAMVKASWSNLQSQMTTGGDISGAMQDLGESIAAAASNILPAIGNIVAGIPSLMSSLIGALMEYAPQMLQSGIEMCQKIAEGFAEALPELISTIAEAAPKILESAQEIVQKFAEGVQTNLPQILQEGVEFITNLVQGISQNLPQLLSTAASIISQFISAAAQAFPQIVSAGIQVIEVLIQGILQNLPAIITAAGQIITSLINALLTDLPQIIEMGLELITTLAQSIIDNLPQIVAAIAQVVAMIVSTIMEHLPEIIEAGINIIVQLVAGLIQAIPQIVAAMPEIISAVADAFSQYDWGKLGSDVISAVKDGVTNAKQALTDAFSGIRDDITGAWDNVKQKTSETWNGIKQSTSETWTNIKGTILTSAQGIGMDVSTNFTAFTTTISGAWTQIKTNTQQTWDAVKQKVSTNGGGIKGVIKTVSDDMSQRWKNAFAKMDEATGGKLTDMKNAVSEKVPAMQEIFDAFDSSGILGVFDLIKDGIKEKIEYARDKVQEAIDKIKGFFDFEWKLPDIKLPHFSISGSFSLNPPSVPSFSVDWYAKAMNQPFMLQNPTLFGAGEAGDEVVYGHSQLMHDIRDAVAAGGTDNIVINVYAQPGQDVDELAEAIERKLTEAMKRREAVFA